MTDDHLPFREINIKLANELEVKLNVLDNSKGLMEDYYTKGKDLPYYADIWPAGVGLGILLASNRFDLKGKHILDIGSGTGIAGLAGSIVGAKAYLCDYLDPCIKLLESNVKLNSALMTEVLKLDWNYPETWPKQVDLIVGSDILFEPECINPVSSLINYLLPDKGYAIISDPDRGMISRFVDQLRNYGLNVFVHEKRYISFDSNYTVCKFIEITKGYPVEQSPYHSLIQVENTLFLHQPPIEEGTFLEPPKAPNPPIL